MVCPERDLLTVKMRRTRQAKEFDGGAEGGWGVFSGLDKLTR